MNEEEERKKGRRKKKKEEEEDGQVFVKSHSFLSFPPSLPFLFFSFISFFFI